MRVTASLENFMKIGIPKEIKDHEYRVGATPHNVEALISQGHEVLVQSKAGEKIGFSDEDYIQAGAQIVLTIEDVYEAEMIIKVKEPQRKEYPLLKEDQILFCYLHLAPDPEQTKALIEKRVIAIAYETIHDEKGRLPLLTPMSEIAGRISVQAGAHVLQMAEGGRGVLLGGVPGVAPGKVVVIGGGIVGTQAATMAMGLGAEVVIMDNNLDRLRELDFNFGSKIKTVYSNKENIIDEIQNADLVIGAVLIPGKTAPKLISRSMIKKMKKGSVIVDVAIDQGGCFETSKPTSHSDPTYVVDGVVHYCVTNMPGACARTATLALTNATMPYAFLLANKGYKKALLENPLLLDGLNVYQGQVTYKGIAHDLGYVYADPMELLEEPSLV